MATTHPLVGSHALYHQNLQEIDGLITDLKEYSGLLTPKHKTDLGRLAGGPVDVDVLTIDHVQKQFQLVMKIRDRLVDGEDNLLEDFDTKTIGTLTTAVNSLLSLFLKSQDKINHLQEIAHLKEAVVTAVSSLEKPQQMLFLTKFDDLCASRKSS